MRIDVEEERPPSKNNMGTCPRTFSPSGFMVRQLKGAWALWTGDWNFPPSRSPISGRCFNVLTYIQ